MFLRKLAEHVRTQNWLAVVLDFLIVVIGVFVGIQVDNWNQGRIERNKEREYLLLIDRDLKRDIEVLDQVRTGVERHAVSTQKILDSASGGEESTDELETAFTLLYLTYAYTPQQSTYVGLRNGAELDIINESELRSAIIDYYEIRQNRFQTEFMADYAVAQRLLHEHFANYVRFLGPDQSGSLFPLPEDLDWTNLLAPMTDAANDVAFLNDLSELNGRAREILEVIDEAKSVNDALQESIAQHIAHGE